jgi:hypothetical protein
VLQHQCDELVVRPFRVVEAEVVIGRTLPAQQLAGRIPMACSSSIKRSRVGGVFKYSMISGSSPPCRIMARVLREVLQDRL